MNIGLFFGSFNPIHIGHLIIANHIVDHTDIDKIWFVLSPHNPLKEANKLLNEYHRLQMVELAIKDNPKFRASNVEFRLSKPSYTYDTLRHLSEQFPLEKFTVIMGSDSWQQIHRWKNYQQIIAAHPIIIYNRPGHEITETHGAHLTEMEAPLLNVSSTFIRKEIKEKKSLRYLLSPPVIEYIEANKLYV
jgi:nicotinate-nucleotide adenylyltransferase